MRVLLIDDQQDSVQAVIDEIKKQLEGSECNVVNFDNYKMDIERHNPHVIVLDLLKGAGAEPAAGLEVHGYIWGAKFCPLIFYTAAPDLVKDQSDLGHPFIKVVQKGAESEVKVLQCIKDFESHIGALDATEREIRSAMNSALREVAPILFKNTQDNAERNDMLVRSARRRVAAKMDDDLLTGVAAGKGLKSWECFLWPPVVEHLLMGDVIRKRGSDQTAPETYAVILTPSCDLVKTATRNPRVTHVLVSHCAIVDRLLKDLGLQKWPTNPKDKTKSLGKLTSMLATGYAQSCMPLPELPGVFPAMIIDFRNLGLININRIGGADEEYERVASVDNPWRELLAWAFMLSAARPGMPDRDYDAWATELSALFTTASN
jgi:hypothetical protein